MVDLAEKVVRSEGFFHAHMRRAYEAGLTVIERSNGKEPAICPVLGSAGSGKSATIEFWLRDYPSQKNPQGKTVMSVIRVTCPVEAAPRSIASSIIRGLQSRVLTRTSTSDVVEQAIAQLKVAEVKTIIFDEVQHIADNLSASKMRVAVNFLQYILEESRVSLILVGLPTAQRFINLEPAFQRRCLSTELLYPYAWSSQVHRSHLAEGVSLIAEAYREQGWKTVLGDPDALKPLYAACIGCFGVLIDFLSHAEVDNPRKVIDMKCLSRAYERAINHKPFSGNPFSATTQLSEKELNAEYVRVLQRAHLPIPQL